LAGDDRGPPLAELQRRFFELVTAPEGVARELEKRGLRAEAVSAIVNGDARASAVERLDVYANMYFFRILDVLRDDFPTLLAAIGDGAFHNLATDYLQAHPSRHPSLRWVGAALPGFLRAHALAAERAWLAELAAFEWALVDVFDRADTPALGRDDVAAVAPQAFASIALAPVAAFEVVPAAFAVEEVWRAVQHRPDERPAAPPRAEAPDGHALVVWRRGVTVQHRAALPGERGALALVREGTTFGALCTALGEQAASEAEAAALAVRLLHQWLSDELLARDVALESPR
jgi:hypothetical protein